MGRKKSTMNPSSKSKSPTINYTPKTEKSQLGNTIKHGVATGIGFGLGNAVTSGIINTISSKELKESNEVPNTNINMNCNKYFELYNKCIEINENNKCKFLLEDFYKCNT